MYRLGVVLVGKPGILLRVEVLDDTVGEVYTQPIASGPVCALISQDETSGVLSSPDRTAKLCGLARVALKCNGVGRGAARRETEQVVGLGVDTAMGTEGLPGTEVVYLGLQRVVAGAGYHVAAIGGGRLTLTPREDDVVGIELVVGI